MNTLNQKLKEVSFRAMNQILVYVTLTFDSNMATVIWNLRCYLHPIGNLSVQNMNIVGKKMKE